MKRLKADIIMWDWKDQPDEDWLNKVLNKYGVYVKYIDTNDDAYGLVITNKKVQDAKAFSLYEDLIRQC